MSKIRREDLPQPIWFVTRLHFQVTLARAAPPPGPLGRLRRWLALKLWPQLMDPQVVDGVMEYMPVRGTD